MNDLLSSKEILSPGGTILCDDYDLWHLGAKKAVDDFVQNERCNLSIIKERFAKIEF